VKRKRTCAYPELDTALYNWFATHRAANTPISGPLLHEKAIEFAQKLNVESPSTSWIDQFKERHGISFRIVNGEAGAVDLATVDNWIKKLWPTIREGYSPENIFNADECGLFYKMLPENSLAFKGIHLSVILHIG